MERLKKLFGSSSSNSGKGSESSTAATIASLRDMEIMLTKKQDFFEIKIEEEMKLVKGHGLKNKRAAMIALKRKKRYERQLQQVDGTLATIEMQRETLETAKNNVDVLHAMRTAAKSLKDAQLNLNSDKVHDIMDDIAEQQEVAKEISDAISSPLNFSTDIDESELEKELEELEQEELDKELLRVGPVSSVEGSPDNGPSEDSALKVPAAIPGPSSTQHPHPKAKQTEEDKELAELAEWGSA